MRIIREYCLVGSEGKGREAERRVGELLKTMAETGERAGKGQPKEMSRPATLPDLGVTKSQSSRWQQIAAVPEDTFEARPSCGNLWESCPLDPAQIPE